MLLTSRCTANVSLSRKRDANQHGGVTEDYKEQCLRTKKMHDWPKHKSNIQLQRLVRVAFGTSPAMRHRHASGILHELRTRTSSLVLGDYEST